MSICSILPLYTRKNAKLSSICSIYINLYSTKTTEFQLQLQQVEDTQTTTVTENESIPKEHVQRANQKHFTSDTIKRHQIEMLRSCMANIRACRETMDAKSAKKHFEGYVNASLKPTLSLISQILEVYTAAAEKERSMNPKKPNIIYRCTLTRSLLLSAIEIYALMQRESIPMTLSIFKNIFTLASISNQYLVMHWMLPNDNISNMIKYQNTNSSFNNEYRLDALSFWNEIPEDLRNLPSPSSTLNNSNIYISAIQTSWDLSTSILLSWFFQSLSLFPDHQSRLLKAFLSALRRNSIIDGSISYRKRTIATLLILLRYSIGSDSAIDYRRYQKRVSTLLERTVDSTSIDSKQDISFSFIPLNRIINYHSDNQNEWNINLDVTLHRLIISIFRRVSAHQLAIDYFKTFCLEDSKDNDESLLSNPSFVHYDASLNGMLFNILASKGHLGQISQLFSYLEDNKALILQMEKEQIDRLQHQYTSSNTSISSLPYNPMYIPLSSMIHALSTSGKIIQAWEYFNKYFQPDTKPTSRHPMSSKSHWISSFTTQYNNTFPVTMIIDMMKGIASLEKLESEHLNIITNLLEWVQSFGSFDLSRFVDIEALISLIKHTDPEHESINRLKKSSYRFGNYFSWSNRRAFIQPGLIHYGWQ